MIYGVDYYPEHDLEARWQVDARLIAEAGFTVVRLAEFAWARMEPCEGQFDFGWLDRAITLLSEHGLEVVLGTPTAAPPQWLAAQHPEILYTNQYGQRAAPQSRRFVCLSNPVYRMASTRVVAAMAERYGQHPAVIGWQIDNEFGCHNTTRCFCQSCQAAFCEWLRRRYGSLEALNAAWGTVFWGQEYSDWSQVRLPEPTPSYHSPGHVLDAYRFASDNVGEYQQTQIAILRDFSLGRPICHNYMANFDQIDYASLSQPLDFVAWDNYVADGVQWHDTARYHDTMRGFKHRPFWVIESPPGHVNWTTYNPDLRPGEARLRSLQAVAHGADGVFYFQWRAFRAGGEQYHSAILPHDGIPGRLFEEAATLGRELAALRPLLAGTEVRPQVAIVSDMASYWALQHQPHSSLLADPQLYVTPWYQALCRRNIAVEFCQPTDDLSAYQLVIAPSLHVLAPQAAENLKQYVAGGGVLIIGPRSGFKEPSNRVTDMPLPGLLGDLAGVRVAEWAALVAGDERTIRGEAGMFESGKAVFWRELLELKGATPLAWYADGAEAGMVAIARNHYGAGETWYVGMLGDQLIDHVLDAQLRGRGLTGLAKTPAGVEVCERVGTGRRVVFVMNHTGTAQTVTLPAQLQDAFDGTAAGEITLPALGVRVFVADAPL